jgi:hypothetical protein
MTPSLSRPPDPTCAICAKPIRSGCIHTKGGEAIHIRCRAQQGGGLAYLIQTSAAAANPTFTLSGAGDVSAAIATFKAGTIGGGGGGSVTLLPVGP